METPCVPAQFPSVWLLVTGCSLHHAGLILYRRAGDWEFDAGDWVRVLRASEERRRSQPTTRGDHGTHYTHPSVVSYNFFLFFRFIFFFFWFFFIRIFIHILLIFIFILFIILVFLFILILILLILVLIFSYSLYASYFSLSFFIISLFLPSLFICLVHEL